MIGIALLAAVQVDEPTALFRAGSWECGRYQSQGTQKDFAACSKGIPDVAYIIFTRQPDAWYVVAKPDCESRAFWNVDSVGFGPLRGRQNRSAEVKSAIVDNFNDAVKGCISTPPTLKIDDADVGALLDATDWVEGPANAASVNGQKKN